MESRSAGPDSLAGPGRADNVPSHFPSLSFSLHISKWLGRSTWLCLSIWMRIICIRITGVEREELVRKAGWQVPHAKVPENTRGGRGSTCRPAFQAAASPARGGSLAPHLAPQPQFKSRGESIPVLSGLLGWGPSPSSPSSYRSAAYRWVECRSVTAILPAPWAPWQLLMACLPNGCTSSDSSLSSAGRERSK